MTDRPPVLLVESLSVRRGERQAVEQVSFDARATDTALVGSNGAGNTSLVGAVLGLLRCSGAPDHALSAARLTELYGPDGVPCRHHHAGICGHG